MKQNIIYMKKINLILIVLQLWIANFANGQGNVNYIPFYTQATFDAKTIDLTKAVGATAGSASVSNGAAVYSLPIMAPPRPEIGVPAPEVSIQYSSMAGDGVLGKGWNIAGMSSIQRVQKTIAHNGKVSPACNSEDEFIIDGQKLFKVDIGVSTMIENWQTEVENFSSIKSFRDGNYNIYKWEIILKDGTKYYYGESPTQNYSYIFSNNTTGKNLNCNPSNGSYIAYFLDYVEFTNGNSRTYKFNLSNDRIGYIEYITDIYGTIYFNYKKRAIGENNSYQMGKKLKNDLILDEIIVKDYNDDLIKKYSFKYSTDEINNYLSEINEEGSNGEKINPTIFLYNLNVSPQSTLLSPFIIPQINTSLPSNFNTGDFNGDGFSDILVLDKNYIVGSYDFYNGFRVFTNNKNNTYTNTYTYNNNNSKFFKESDYRNSKSKNVISNSDFNGDGKDDIIMNDIREVYDNNSKFLGFRLDNTTLFLSNSSGFSNYKNEALMLSVPSFGPIDVIHSEKLNTLVKIGDFDGDGNVDFMYRLKNTQTSNVKYDFYFSFPSKGIYNKLSNTSNTILTNNSNVEEIEILDFDGDGKDDIMILNDQGNSIYTCNFFNTGNINIYSLTSNNFPKSNDVYFIGDFNGDKKTDVMYGNQTTAFTIGYSTGNIFENATSQIFTGKYPNVVSQANDIYQGDLIRIGDFNGDGKDDILHSYNLINECKYRFNIYYSKGNSFKQETNVVDNIFLDSENNYYSVLVGDFDGDGMLDLNSKIRISNPANYNNCNPTNYIYYKRQTIKFNKGKFLMSKIKNGLLSKSEFTYNTLNKIPISTVYDNNNNFNGNLYKSFQMDVITSFKNELGETLFNYYGAMLNKKGRGFLGFRQIDQTDLNRNETTSIYLNKFSSFGNYPDFVYNDYTEKKRNNQVLESSRIYYTPGINDGQRLWLKKDKVETTSYLNGNNTENTVFDNYGNIVSKEAIAADGKITKVLYNYGSNATNRPAMPISSTTTYTKSGVPDISYTTQYEYTPMYQIKKKIEFAGLSKTITSEYLYNWVGNLTEEKITGANMTSRKNETVYDPLGMYVIKKKNSLGQESSIIMDPKWNAPLSITDIGGLTTTFAYDGFGRKISETLPTGKIINTEYLWDNSINTQNTNYSVYKVKSSTSNSPIVERYFDKMNREIAAKQQQFDGSYTTVLKQYDLRNRNYFVDNVDATGQRIQAVQNQYDDYDRVTNIQHIDKYNTIYNMENVSYIQGNNSWEIVKTIPSSITNPIGKSSYTKIDFAGKVLESKENNKNAITYTYNAEGKVLKVNSGTLTLSESVYDEYGRQTKLIDNSAGTQTYEYNSLGEITQQKNPNDGFIKFEYDVLGRKTKEIINEGTINYVYYPNGSGAKTNMLKEIKGFNSQNRELYDYDNFGRLIQSKKFLFNSPSISTGWITNFVYNADGKIVQKTAPTGNVYNYQYNSFGFLTEIKKGNQSIYTHLANTSSGKPYQFNLGPQTTTMSYDDMDRLSSIQSPFYNEAYIWDNINGNLISKNDIRNNLNYSYEYDDFERLTSENLDANGKQVNNSLEYFDDGRVKQKGTVTGEDYLYHANKTYAVKNITDAINFPVKNQNITYNSFNKATKIAQGDYELNYTYNHAYDRMTASLLKNRVLQYNRYYCGTTDFTYDANNALKYAIDYVYAGDQLVALDITTPNKNELWYVQGDYQNTIRTVFNDQGQSYTQSFDAWGNWRESDPSNATFGEIAYERPASLPEWLYRGYTEQEHLPEFRLINLNARLYDPHVGRMLSPDNFVTAKSLQGFNRYSYAHNNPIKYSDPDGNFPIIAEVAGLVNGVKSLINGESFFAGFGKGWKQSWQITGGLFQWSDDKNFIDNVTTIFSKLTWEAPQTYLGFGIGQILNTATLVNDVNYFRGATVLDTKLEGGAFSLGSYIVGPDGFKPDYRDHLFVHEFGHYLQSKDFGPLYMNFIALPSLSDIIINPNSHRNKWYESDASKRASRYFSALYSDFDVESFSNGTPSHYINPRTNSRNREQMINSNSLHWTDFPINILFNGGLGLLGFIF